MNGGFFPRTAGRGLENWRVPVFRGDLGFPVKAAPGVGGNGAAVDKLLCERS